VVPSYIDILVKGSIENIQNLVQHAFSASGFEVKWHGATRGKAEKGRIGAKVAAGALGPEYGVDFELAPNADGADLRLLKSNLGRAGGYFGARKIEAQFQSLGDTLAGWFQQQGVWLGTTRS